MERKPSQDIGQCAFVYFSLKNNVGTTCISISTQGFVENMKISGFSLLKPFFTEKWTSEGAMERKSGQNRLPMYLCVFLIENQCWHSEHVDQHRRRFTFLWKNGFKREKPPDFMVFDESLSAMERKSSENRLQLYLCLFPIKKEGWYKLQSDHHLRTSTFLWKNEFKRGEAPDFHVFYQSLHAMERKPSEKRLQLHICVFPMEKEGWHKLQFDQHLRPSTFSPEK